ncbi:hypothetical protein RND71_027779 [Anisodus tanguticus]|uniref:Uncharacterized protein n=1 Tax=Anisodus tanguticus TaxID=243964 RepID=A0AAE1RII2_9SOLA|nr:hypothetical protein RND71_027779 [Anisodus tanguticus]
MPWALFVNYRSKDETDVLRVYLLLQNCFFSSGAPPPSSNRNSPILTFSRLAGGFDNNRQFFILAMLRVWLRWHMTNESGAPSPIGPRRSSDGSNNGGGVSDNFVIIVRINYFVWVL